MAIKGNSALKWGVPLVLLVACVIALRACQQSSDSEQASTRQHNDAPRHLTKQEREAIGVEADTPKDTVATLVAKIHSMRKQLDQTRQQSEQLQDQNKRLAEKNQNVQSAISSAISRQSHREKQRNASMVNGLKNELSGLRAKLEIEANNSSSKHDRSNDRMPVGLGLKGGQAPAGAQGEPVAWVNPLGDALPQSGQGGGQTRTASARSSAAGTNSAFRTAFDNGVDAAQSAAAKARRNAHVGGAGNKDNPGVPVYTVPKNATLVGSVAMSALLGRVPRDGTVQDPYPFKIVIGRENLVANGIELPEVKGAIVSGTAVGDWTLSCVRGTVKSITFIFADGTSEVVPKSDKPGKNSKNNKQREIGYLSNPAGVPCVSGQRKTNARKVILTNLLLSAGQGAANAVSGGQTTTSVNGLGATQGVTGNIGKYVAGRAASEGMSQVRKWFNQRYGSTFDAVYVPPGHAVAVNIDKTLPINYDRHGRKVHDVLNHSHNGLD